MNKTMFKKNLQKKGFGLIEAVIGVSIVLVSLLSTISAYNFFLKIAQKNTKIIKAEFLLNEGVEAVRSIRDLSWIDFVNMNNDTDCYLSFVDGFWQSSSNNIFIDDVFERKFIITDIYRDENDNIASSGTLYPNTKGVKVLVSWNNSEATTTKSMDIILTNLFEN